MQHPATDLTLQQRQAIDLFTQGHAVSNIAKSVGVARETLWRWRQQEPFANALQETRRQRYDAMREQAAELLRLAMVSLTRELKKAEDPKICNPIEAAFKILDFINRSGLASEAPPPLPAMARSMTTENQELSESSASFVNV